MIEHPLQQRPTSARGATRQPGLAGVLALAWLAVVLIGGILAPWIARGGGDPAARAPVPWSPAERLNDRNVSRLSPGSWSTDPLVPRERAARPGPASDEEIRTELRRNPDSRPFYLGSDTLGQDVLSNIVHGCRVALLVGSVAAGVALTLGVSLGALMGYLGGWTDRVLMRIVEVLMSVPTLFILVLAAAVLPRSPVGIMATIGALSWTGIARLTRAECMRVRSADFVLAARAAGLPTPRIIVRHVLPSAITPALVEAPFLFASAILAEAALAYLGLMPDDTASWGRLLSQAPGAGGDFAWWLGVFPGACLFLTVLSCNALGEIARSRSTVDRG